MNATRQLKRRMAMARERAIFPIIMKNVFDKIIEKFSRSPEQILAEYLTACFAPKCDQKTTKQ